MRVRAFVEDGAQARRLGDVEGAGSDTKLLGENAKLKLNAGYGKTITNQEKHHDLLSCNEKNATKHVNYGRFHALSQLGEDAYVVEKFKSTICLDLPWTGDAMVVLCSKTYLGYSLAAEREERENLAQETRLNEALDSEDHEFDDVFDLHDPDEEEIVEPPPLPLVPQPREAHKMSCKGLQKKNETKTD